MLACLLTLCTVSALQDPVPRNMPFGVTGPSPVVTDAQSAKIQGFQVSFVNTLYTNEAEAMNAINQGKIYGAYIAGTTSDTLVTVPSKSFDALIEIEPLFLQAAAKHDRPLTVQQAKPLPAGKDPVGAVAGLLLLPTIIGGLLAAILIYKATGALAQHWRAAILLGYSFVGAALTDVIAGPLLGAYGGDRFWPLLLCFALVTFNVAVVTAALLALLRLAGTILALVVFIIAGLPSAGAAGVSLLPIYWQSIGAALPPRYAASLFQNVLYFSSNNIATPAIVLAVYALVATAALGYLEWLRPGRASAAAAQRGTPTAIRSLTVRLLVGVFVVVAFEQCVFGFNYMSSGHNPVARNLPFAVTAASPVTATAQKNLSLKIADYPNGSAAKGAINQAKAWGALVPGAGGTHSLLVVPTISALAPLDLGVQFTRAASSQGQKVQPTSYAPKPLPRGDLFGIVLSLLLFPLLLVGMLSATTLRAVTGVATGRWRALALLGFAVVTALLINVIAATWLDGYPPDKFWAVWPILVLIIVVVAWFAAVAQRVLGAAGTLLTGLAILQFGKPSSGGANGVPYLPGFWTWIGPILPPRNAYILLRNTIYFGGHGIWQALIILLAYFVALGVILAVLDWYHRPAPELAVTRETELEAAAAAAPAGVTL